MQGKLIYLMGPSGSGKDSLLEAARESLTARGLKIAQRVITRSGDGLGEAAQSVSPEQFQLLEQQDAFAMSWQANGLSYGIPKHIELWMEQGYDVLVNGSRGYFEQAQQRYHKLLPILLSVSEDVLRQRLVARGRESLEQIEARLARSRDLLIPPPGVVVLDNSGDLAKTVEGLLKLCA